jgi:hypothetical protein
MLWFRGSHAKAREQAPWLEWLPDEAFWHDFEAPCQAADRTSADQQATLRVDSRQSLGAVRAVFSRLEQPGRSPLQGDGRGPADRFLATRVDAAISCGRRSPQREDRFRTRGIIGNVYVVKPCPGISLSESRCSSSR